jgi:hypothetical protein
MIVLKLLENIQDIDKEDVDWKEFADTRLVLKACCILYVLCPQVYLKRFLEPKKIISSLKNFNSCENSKLLILFLKWIYKNEMPIVSDEPVSSKIVNLLGQFSGIKELEPFIRQIASAIPNSTSIVEVMTHLSEDQEEELILFRGHGEPECIVE